MESVDAAVESYALEYSVSQAEASRRLGRIGAIQEVLATIRGLESARVAGWGIDHRGDFGGWVLLTGDQPAGAAAAAAAAAHSDVEIRIGVQHSYAELLAAQRGLSEKLFAAQRPAVGGGALGSTGAVGQAGPGTPGDTEGGGVSAGVAAVVTFLETDMAGNAVRVGIDPALAPEVGPLGTVSELAFDQAASIVAELLQDHLEVPFTVADGRGLVLAARFQGGETASSCTSGFTARRSRSGGGYDYGVIIAGHCGTKGPSDTLSVNMKHVVLPLVYGWLSPTADAQFHRIPIPTSGSHYVLDDYLCRDPRSYPNPSCDVTGTVARADMPDDYICHTGERSGISCGKVVSISSSLGNICFDSAGANTVCDSVFVRVHGQLLRGCKGDSGGPAYRGGSAYGITAAASDKDDCDSGGKSVVFSGIREVESFLNVQVLTEPVTLSAP